jgi:hypothetical protein
MVDQAADQAEPTGLDYPFTPKTVTHLRAGHFWGIELVGNTGWACGRVLGANFDLRHGKRVTMVASVMDWHGDTRPDTEAVKAMPDLLVTERTKPYPRCLTAHVGAISAYGGSIDGWSPLPKLDLPEMHIDSSTRIYRGGQYVRDAKDGEPEIPSMSAINLAGLDAWANQTFSGLPPEDVQQLLVQRYERLHADGIVD